MLFNPNPNNKQAVEIFSKKDVKKLLSTTDI